MPEVEYNGLKFNYRPKTTDWGIIQEACGGLYTRFFDVKPKELWLDIGAHIGAFTCYAASKGAKVISYEPMPDNYTLLEQNICLNKLEEKVIPLPYGITKNGDSVNLFIDTVNYGNCSIYNKSLQNSITIDTFSAYDFNVIKENFNMKIDTEGCEYGIISSIDLTKVNKLIFEYHYWLGKRAKEEWEEIQTLLVANFSHITEVGGYMHYAWK